MSYAVKNLKQPEMPNQRGSTCGLYALEGILVALDPRTHYRATADHRKYPDPMTRPIEKKSIYTSLRSIAKNDLNITVIGEVFSADDLVKLAKHIGLTANVASSTDWKNTIKTALDANKYVIAPFGVDISSGRPQTTGMYAHYCVIWGYSIWTGARLAPVGTSDTVQARHWGKNYTFRIANLYASSARLQVFPEQSWMKKVGSTNLSYNKVTTGNKMVGAKLIPEADLPKNLAGKLVIVGE